MSLHIPKPEQTNLKIIKLKKDGVSKLHIVSDFDKTLTKAKVNGKELNSSFAQIRTGAIFPQNTLKKRTGFLFFIIHLR